ncbi:cation:H+ antiporter [Halogranum amylolyticum]|uniref:Cation:H+ antiporter n=1 Tax=Halogranum amylolyticum TaxID=660520 RepID=A0A1H8W836_9EURY|nr:sodium:calcium antiporter [Halogranum amylolyticum]SEP23815.1 cation:H+ antiporter [Halogranum amylolyticum]
MTADVGLLGLLAVGAVALVVLVESAEIAVDRALSLATYYDVSDVVVSVTVLAVGTSLPELAAHVIASLGILVGTLDYGVTSATILGGNMGSSTVQQTLLMGVFLIGFGHVTVTERFLRTTYLPMLGAFALTFAVAIDGSFGRLDGVVLLIAFAGYTYYALRQRERRLRLPETESTNVRRDVLVAIGALVGILASSYVVLVVVQVVVDELALGGSMLGVVTLGLAAALPELSTVVDAIRRRAPNVALGTLVGSNVVNPLVGIGLGGVISGYRVPRSVVVWDLPFKFVVGVALLAVVLRRDSRTLRRHDGALLVVAYFGYVTVRLLLFATE